MQNLSSKKTFKIVVTGGAGFIGSNVVLALNNSGYLKVIIVDKNSAHQNLADLQYEQFIDSEKFLNMAQRNALPHVDAVIHLGASVNTLDKDRTAIFKNNTGYSKTLFDYCVRHKAQFIYASSAATYGDGSSGYRDTLRKLKPLNAYAESKHAFDEMVLDAAYKPPQWVGLKFFNVYGPRESHKGQMASMAYHLYNQIRKNGEARLFKSYHADYGHGEQKRDFVYVKDVARVILFFLEHPQKSGIFNLGTGRARTFGDLAHAVFSALAIKPQFNFIDMPEALRGQFQYFTEADITRLREVGYGAPFYSLEEGVGDYVKNYLTES